MTRPAQARSTYTVDFNAKSAQRPTHPDMGRTPRVARMLALAHKIDAKIRDGELRDLADAAWAIGVTRARMTQITNLLLLAPEIQEAILNLPLVTTGRDPVSERALRRIVAETGWSRQRSLWDAVIGSATTHEERAVMDDETEIRLIDDLTAWDDKVPDWAQGMVETIRHGRRSQLRLLVATRSEQVIGFLLYEPSGGRWGTHFHEVIVDPPLRRTGIGRELYDRMLQGQPPRPITAHRATEDGRIVLERWGFKFREEANEWVLE